MAKKKKLKVLSMSELEKRFAYCEEEKLCFISKEALKETFEFVKHPELGNVKINSERLS